MFSNLLSIHYQLQFQFVSRSFRVSLPCPVHTPIYQMNPLLSLLANCGISSPSPSSLSWTQPSFRLNRVADVRHPSSLIKKNDPLVPWQCSGESLFFLLQLTLESVRGEQGSARSTRRHSRDGVVMDQPLRRQQQE